MESNADFLDLTEILNLDDIVVGALEGPGSGCTNNICSGAGNSCTNTGCTSNQDLD